MRDGHTAQPSVHKTYVGQTLSWREVASIRAVDTGHWYTTRRTVRESGVAEGNETVNTDTDTMLSVNFLTLTEPPRKRQKVPDKIS